MHPALGVTPALESAQHSWGEKTNAQGMQKDLQLKKKEKKEKIENTRREEGRLLWQKSGSQKAFLCVIFWILYFESQCKKGPALVLLKQQPVLLLSSVPQGAVSQHHSQAQFPTRCVRGVGRAYLL